MKKINLAEKLAGFQEHWKPKIVSEVNDVHIKVAKFRGEFVWHRHDAEDELFYVVKGTMTMRLRDGDVVVNPGEFITVPRGVEHCPVSDEEVHLMLVEPKSTLNTGDVRNERTLEKLDRI
ncbi:MAG: cupin domain-containing protein [Planctomycetota bacterium]|jgi:mannose-6-phosphate isomerase-like protein (cupin superfamily)